VVLGCAGMAEMCAHIAEEIGVPVVDGVTAATLTVQSLVTMGLATGKRGEYAPPPPKDYKLP
jgi:allantoin racemase